MIRSRLSPPAALNEKTCSLEMGLRYASSAATICIAVAIGCAANWVRNRTMHCGITAPAFLVAGTVFLLSDMGILAINQALVWPIVAIVTGLAFLLEWRYSYRT
jgi:uncharacterized membrane protein YgdD (TMEM256/DUF423 family)